MNIRLEGMDEVLESLDSLIEESTLEAALGKACAVVEAAAKQKAPKDTGELRRSITSKVELQGDEMVGVVYTPLEYAPYVEYGTGLFAVEGGRADVPWSYQNDKGEWISTSGQKPQPYMRPALDENREEIMRILAEVITDG